MIQHLALRSVRNLVTVNVILHRFVNNVCLCLEVIVGCVLALRGLQLVIVLRGGPVEKHSLAGTGTAGTAETRSKCSRNRMAGHGSGH